MYARGGIEMVGMYECELCGERFGTFVTGKEMAGKIMVGMALNDADFLRRIGASYTFPKCTHFCKDGGQGLAKFIGFKMEEKEVRNDAEMAQEDIQSKTEII